MADPLLRPACLPQTCTTAAPFSLTATRTSGCGQTCCEEAEQAPHSAAAARAQKLAPCHHTERLHLANQNQTAPLDSAPPVTAARRPLCGERACTIPCILAASSCTSQLSAPYPCVPLSPAQHAVPLNRPSCRPTILARAPRFPASIRLGATPTCFCGVVFLLGHSVLTSRMRRMHTRPGLPACLPPSPSTEMNPSPLLRWLLPFLSAHTCLPPFLLPLPASFPVDALLPFTVAPRGRLCTLIHPPTVVGRTS